MELCPYNYFRWSGYFRGSWVSFVTTGRIEGHNNYFKDCCLMNSQSTFPFLKYRHKMAILSKGREPDDFELHNFKNLAYYYSSLRSNFVRMWISIDFGNLSLRGYLPLIRKESVGWSCCLRQGGLPFARNLSLESFSNSYLCFWLSLLHSVSYLFFINWSPSLSLCTVFDVISSIT